MRGNVDKWREAFVQEAGWDNATYRAIQEAEFQVIQDWLAGLRRPRYDILELGCGNGLLAERLCAWLEAAGLPYNYRVTDLLPEAVAAARARFPREPKGGRLTFETLDVYELVDRLGPGTQPLIVSTGHASAATYRRAVPLVARVLAPGGVLICDFINHLSPRRFLPNLPGSVKRFFSVARHRREESMDLYHFGRFWVESFFAQAGLQKIKLQGIGVLRYPLLAMFRKAGGQGGE